jgi:hypothetical protein
VVFSAKLRDLSFSCHLIFQSLAAASLTIPAGEFSAHRLNSSSFIYHLFPIAGRGLVGGSSLLFIHHFLRPCSAFIHHFLSLPSTVLPLRALLFQN